jgi:hypothetical protein
LYRRESWSQACQDIEQESSMTTASNGALLGGEVRVFFGDASDSHVIATIT